MSVVQHAGLTTERWSTFAPGQQLLMIANEMHRASRFVAADDRPRLRTAYERVLRLADLTVQARRGLNFRRELLRWRDLIALLYVAEAPSALDHRAAMRALLQLSPASAPQVRLLL